MKFELEWHTPDRLPDEYDPNRSLYPYQLVVHRAGNCKQPYNYVVGYYQTSNQVWVDTHYNIIKDVIGWAYLPSSV